VGKIEENIFSMKLKWKSLRREEFTSEGIVSTFQSSGSSTLLTADMILLCTKYPVPNS
jgi:hypothetical protein